jgi:hypothetical protein
VSIIKITMNKTLMIGATHGNEPIGVRALESIEQNRKDFDWVVGNPRAYDLNKRFEEADLNRSAPGSLTSSVYEERRAAELIRLSQKYESVIDLHGTSKETGLFIIITNPSDANLELASRFNIKHIVVWPAITPELEGPVSEFFPCGLEIECGPKESIETQKKLESVLVDYLDGKSGELEQEVFEVYGELRSDPGISLKEFEEVTVDGETFFPLLIGTYSDAYGVVCYKLKKRGEIN